MTSEPSANCSAAPPMGSGAKASTLPMAHMTASSTTAARAMVALLRRSRGQRRGQRARRPVTVGLELRPSARPQRQRMSSFIHFREMAS